MNVLSLFDGISCARVALNGNVGVYYASEICPRAISVAKKNFPSTIHLGDVKGVKQSSITVPIDLLIGGSPCQDLSVAKKDRKGLAGDRSKLFYEFVRLRNELNPKWFLLENVASMPKDARDTITKELGVEPIMIDASLVSAQSRKRLFWTNIPNVTLPQDRKIVLKDILQPTVDELYFVKNQTLTRRQEANMKKPDEKAFCLTSTNYKGTQANGTTLISIGHIGPTNYQQNRVYSIEGKASTLSASSGGLGAKTGLYEAPRVRRLTPVECERLQGLPDNYTEGISMTARYKCLGNAFNVEVVRHILTHIPSTL